MSYYYGNQSRGGWGHSTAMDHRHPHCRFPGLFAYFTHTSVNPTTGETQRVSLTPDQEIALGMQSAPEMVLPEMGGEVPPNDPQAKEVQYIGQRVWQQSDAAKSPYPFHYHLLADTNTINAFALPGGEVFITKGLLDRLTTEGELAGVLGHETGHVVERHVAHQMAQKRLGQYLVTGAGRCRQPPIDIPFPKPPSPLWLIR